MKQSEGEKQRRVMKQSEGKKQRMKVILLCEKKVSESRSDEAVGRRETMECDEAVRRNETKDESDSVSEEKVSESRE